MRYISTPEEAEENAAQRMVLMGFLDARVTIGGADGGIDVVSSRAVAQVKWRGAAVGRPELQNLYGARGQAHHQALLFFAAAPYTEAAQEYARSVNMALFTYEPHGELAAVGPAAEALLSRGNSRVAPDVDEHSREQLRAIKAELTERLRFRGASRAASSPGFWSRHWRVVLCVFFAVGALANVTSEENSPADRVISGLILGGLAVFFGVLQRRHLARAGAASDDEPAAPVPDPDAALTTADLRRQVQSLANEAFDETWTSFAVHVQQRMQTVKRAPAASEALRMRLDAELSRMRSVMEEMQRRHGTSVPYSELRRFLEQVDDARARLDRIR